MPTFRRLLGFLRPYRRQLIWSLLLAWLAMGMTVLIPLLSGSAVNAIEDERRDDILPLVLALFGAGILRLALTVGRRFGSNNELGGRCWPATGNCPAQQSAQPTT